MLRDAHGLGHGAVGGAGNRQGRQLAQRGVLISGQCVACAFSRALADHQDPMLKLPALPPLFPCISLDKQISLPLPPQLPHQTMGSTKATISVQMK